MCLAQGPQRSDAGEAWTRGPSVSIQALYHWATALPPPECKTIVIQIRPNILSGLIWVQIVCKGYLQTATVDKS